MRIHTHSRGDWTQFRFTPGVTGHKPTPRYLCWQSKTPEIQGKFLIALLRAKHFLWLDLRVKFDSDFSLDTQVQEVPESTSGSPEMYHDRTNLDTDKALERWVRTQETPLGMPGGAWESSPGPRWAVSNLHHGDEDDKTGLESTLTSPHHTHLTVKSVFSTQDDSVLQKGNEDC